MARTSGKTSIKDWLTKVFPKINEALKLSNGEMMTLYASLLAELAEYFEQPTVPKAVKILAKYAWILKRLDEKHKCQKKDTDPE